MPDDLRPVASALLTVVTTYWLHSTLLLAATWIVLRICRVRSHALRERLWKMAALIPLCTAPLEVSIHLSRPVAQIALDRLVSTDVAKTPHEESSNQPLPHVELATVPETEVAIQSQSAPDAPVVPRSPTVAISPVSPEPVEPMAPTPCRASGTATPVSHLSGALIASLCLIGLFLPGGILLMTWQSMGFRLRLRKSRDVAGPTRDCLDGVLRRVGARRHVRLLSCRWCGQPAAFGLFRWTIVLPQNGTDELAEDELAALFAHEIAHLVRGDTLWLWICRVLCSCFAFQPLNFVVRKELRRSAEFLCDEWAVRKKANAFALARCLTRVAQWNRPSLSRNTALAAIAGRSTLSERVERLITGMPQTDRWDTQLRLRIFAPAALVFGFLFASFAPRTGLTAEPQNVASKNGDLFDSRADDSAPTLGASLEILDLEVAKLRYEMDVVDKLMQPVSNDPQIRRRVDSLHSRMKALSNSKRRLVALCNTLDSQEPTTSN